MLLTPPSVTSCHTFSDPLPPLERDVLYGRPLSQYIVSLWGVCGLLVESTLFVTRPKGHGFDSHSSRPVGTLGKSLTHSCLWRFGVLTPTQYHHCSRGRL